MNSIKILPSSYFYFSILRRIKIILNIFFSVTLIFLDSCSSGKVPLDEKVTVENDLKKNNLKGDVILVKTTNPEDDSIYQGFSLQVYNEKGMMTKDFFGRPKVTYRVHEWIYDNERIVLSKFNSELTNEESKYSYNSIGKLESIFTLLLDDTTKFYYNKDGKLIKELGNDFFIPTTKEYFYTKSKLDSIVFISSGDILSPFATTEIFGVNNRIKKTYNLESSGKNILIKIINYQNNEKGDCIKEVCDEFDTKGIKTKSRILKYEYIYDETGNWIRKSTIEEGKLIFTENRTIVYKGSEINPYLSEVEKIINSLIGIKNNNNSKNKIEK